VSFTDMPEQSQDDFFMAEALKEAHKALALDEVPVGAVIVHSGKIIGRGHNLTEQLNDVTAHAEMQAFTAAANYTGGKYLKDCTLYVTIEPCVMCGGALKWARFNKVVFGATEPKFGYSTISDGILYHKTNVVKGVLADECALLMKQFFAQKRK
jgi:tRNA(adenine34) deaminase